MLLAKCQCSQLSHLTYWQGSVLSLPHHHRVESGPSPYTTSVMDSRWIYDFKIERDVPAVFQLASEC